MKKAVIWAALLACLILAGCNGDPQPTQPPAPLPSHNLIPIITTRNTSNKDTIVLTKVSVTVFGDTAILARNPVLNWGEEEMIGQARDISQGGRIGCRDAEGNPVRITKVIITENLVPRSTRDWFRDLPYLTQIQGLELITTDHVTDMSNMFSGCMRLNSVNIDDWNVEKVTNMAGIFDGCDSMGKKPEWFREN